MFTSYQIAFVRKYCSVMHPLASALDILQDEQNLYIGYLLSTLVSLQNQLRTLRPTQKCATPLVDAVLAGVDKRFSGYFDTTDLIVASVTLPQFKLRWLDDLGKERARSLLQSQVAALNDSKNEAESQLNHTKQEDDFFCFSVSDNDSSNQSSDLDSYLADTSRELLSLQKYPAVLQLFLQFNTPLPSSASVERLFSLGSQIYVPRRNKLTDLHFERQLLLRANKLFAAERA